MAEPVVSIVLETIRDLLVQEAKFYSGVKSEVEGIQLELQRMRSFLKDADAKQDSDERVHTLVAQVREAAYDIEDSIIVYAAARIAYRRKNKDLLRRTSYWWKEVSTTYRVGNHIADIKNKIVSMTASLQTYGVKSVPGGEHVGENNWRKWDLRRSYSHVVDEDIVGLEEDIAMLARYLVDENTDRVLSIVGMGGLGKTTIARKLYGHIDVRRHFDGFGWTCLSQQWEKKDILQGLLIKLMPEKREEILGMRDEELVKQLHEVQMKKKCLVVVDDIWSIQDWESLKYAFPNTRINGNGTKLLLTTRNKEVASHVFPSGNGSLYEPKFLSNEQSWELLKRKAFPKREGNYEPIDKEMEILGKEMVGRCSGLPLAILVLAGVLVTKHTFREWEMVHENINWHLRKGGQNVLAFSYYDLPYQLKQCFLYMANLREDFEIEAEKLYQLWLAEGFISSEDRAEEETMMDVAERYLAELAQRYMVQVNVKETAGGFKNCRLHDLMRELCLSKAKDENFTRVLDFKHEKKLGDSGSSSNTSTITTRRLCIFLDPNNVRQLPSSGCVGNAHRVRSMFLYANDYKGNLLEQMRSHLKNYNLLRVLDLQGFHYADHLPKAIGDLIHLRYLSLSYSQFKNLPSTLGKLKYLQTLDLQVSDVSLQVPNVLWKMESLRHLYLPEEFHTEDGSKLRLDELSELETLVNFDTSLCDVKDLDRLTNLRKLRAFVKDNLDDLPNIIKYISFTQNNLRRSSLSISCPKFCTDAELSLLRTLLGCHRLYKLSIRARIGKLPEFYHFSSTIAKISFKASALEEDPMATLERLPKLSSLTLYDNAFVGCEMVCLESGFPRLLYLKLWGLPNLERWRIEERAMPKLSRLVIAHCDNLAMLPDGLKFITTLQKLNIRRMPQGFKNQLRTENGDEGESFYKVRHVPDIKFD